MEMWLWREMVKTNRMKPRKSNERVLEEIGEITIILMVNRTEKKIKFIEHLIRHNDFLKGFVTQHFMVSAIQ